MAKLGPRINKKICLENRWNDFFLHKHFSIHLPKAVKIPNGPALSGPILSCINAATFLSP
jgi:hypothetical protein